MRCKKQKSRFALLLPELSPGVTKLNHDANELPSNARQQLGNEVHIHDEIRDGSNIGREEKEGRWAELVNEGVEQSRNEQYSKALHSFQSSLRDQMMAAEDGSDHIAHTLANIGSVFLKQGRLFLAAEALDEALTMKRKLRETEAQEEADKIRLVSILNNLGNVACLRGEYTRSLQYYQESLREARRRTTPKDELADVLYNLGRLNILQEEWDAALSVLNDALKLQKELYGHSSELLAETLDLLGFAHLSSHSPDNALVCFSEALTIYKDIGGTVNTRVGTSLVHVGMVMETRGQAQHAWNTYAAAKDIFIKAGVDGDFHGYRAARQRLAAIDKAAELAGDPRQVDQNQNQMRFISIEDTEPSKDESEDLHEI